MWSYLIDRESIYRPVVIGEWSFAAIEGDIGVSRQVKQSFVNAEQQSILHAAGSYVWSWKLERGIGREIYDDQDLQLQLRSANGLRLMAIREDSDSEGELGN
jgi:hypothetical protein